MKVIFNPEIYLLNQQVIHDGELDRFLHDNEVEKWGTDTDVGAEITVETAGRICYMSFAKPRPGGNEEYIKHIKDVRHGSVLEHAVWSLIITGVSRTFSHELVRHRTGWAYSQLSQRYVDESVCEVVVPNALADEVRAAQELESWVEGYMETSGADREEAIEIYHQHHPNCDKDKIEIGLDWLACMTFTNEKYRKITEYLFKKQEKTVRLPPGQALPQEQKTAIRKTARQAGRSVLPNATETKLVVTANMRAFRHFIEMRAHVAAEPEIRVVAHTIWQKLKEVCPNGFSDYTETHLDDGTVALETPYRKV